MSEEEAKSESLGSEEEKMEVEKDKVKPQEKKKNKRKTKRKTSIKKIASKGDKPKRIYKIKQGTRAIREIKKAQEKTDLLIQYAGMDRFVRDTLKKIFPEEKYRLEKPAVKTFMEGTQQYFLDLFRMSTAATVHAGRQTLLREDMKLARLISEETGGNL